VRVTDGLGNISVASGLAVGDLKQCMPAGELEGGSAEIERERKFSALASEVFVKFLEKGRECGLRFAQIERAGVDLLLTTFEFEAHQAFSGRSEEERADG
jgi:hypothetical protein